MATEEQRAAPCYGERTNLTVHKWVLVLDERNLPDVECERCGMYWLGADLVHP